MNTLATKIFFSAGLGILAMLPAANADEWNQKTVVKFSESVEIPGQVLPAGTYVFKLLNSTSNRNIIQVFNKDENHVFGTFLAIPSHRARPSEKTVIRFEERAAGSPQALKAWFYPNRTSGHEFVYPKNEALELAKANDMPVPSMPTDLIRNITQPAITLNGPEIMALTTATLTAEEPNGDEVQLAAAFPNGNATTQLPAELPATGSPMPFIGLVGLVSLAVAAIFRRRAARVQ
jgi:LPXTG-motif cell wall-anchored protein